LDFANGSSHKLLMLPEKSADSLTQSCHISTDPKCRGRADRAQGM